MAETVGIVSTGVQTAANTAIGALVGQLALEHEATQAVASAIGLPTNDLAALQMQTSQLGNVGAFGAAMRAGLAQQAKLCGLTAANNVATQVTDTGASVAVAAITA